LLETTTIAVGAANSTTGKLSAVPELDETSN
jgi:hypothetical protein